MWPALLSKIDPLFPQTVHSWGSILERKELATLTGRAPELCGWALCPGLVLLLSSVAGLCGWALSSVAWLCVRVLSSSCPCLGRAPELCGWSLARFTGEECGQTNSDVNADKNSLMKQFALGVKVIKAYQEIGF